MLHEKSGKRGTRNRRRYQVAQSWLNRLYTTQFLPPTPHNTCWVFVWQVHSARISYVSITDFAILFWSGNAYFGKQDNTYISSLDFSIPQSLIQTLEFGIVLRFSSVRLGQEWLVWSGAGELLYPFQNSLHHLTFSGRSFMDFGSNAAEPRFPE